jgi:ribose-phosphate pyrophosphokinase
VPASAGSDPLAVVSPDPGGAKRALLWREALEARLGRPVGFAMIDKRRSQDVVSSSSLVAGDVAGATALLIDDLIASGETMRRAAAALRRAGARRVIAFAAHGLFVGAAAELFDDPQLDAVVVTDSVPPFRLPASDAVRSKLRVCPAAPLVADAIRRCHAAWRH